MPAGVVGGEMPSSIATYASTPSISPEMLPIPHHLPSAVACLPQAIATGVIRQAVAEAVAEAVAYPEYAASAVSPVEMEDVDDPPAAEAEAPIDRELDGERQTVSSGRTPLAARAKVPATERWERAEPASHEASRDSSGASVAGKEPLEAARAARASAAAHQAREAARAARASAAAEAKMAASVPVEAHSRRMAPVDRRARTGYLRDRELEKMATRQQAAGSRQQAAELEKMATKTAAAMERSEARSEAERAEGLRAERGEETYEEMRARELARNLRELQARETNYRQLKRLCDAREMARSGVNARRPSGPQSAEEDDDDEYEHGEYDDDDEYDDAEEHDGVLDLGNLGGQADESCPDGDDGPMHLPQERGVAGEQSRPRAVRRPPPHLSTGVSKSISRRAIREGMLLKEGPTRAYPKGGPRGLTHALSKLPSSFEAPRWQAKGVMKLGESGQQVSYTHARARARAHAHAHAHAHMRSRSCPATLHTR